MKFETFPLIWAIIIELYDDGWIQWLRCSLTRHNLLKWRMKTAKKNIVSLLLLLLLTSVSLRWKELVHCLVSATQRNVSHDNRIDMTLYGEITKAGCFPYLCNGNHFGNPYQNLTRVSNGDCLAVNNAKIMSLP